MARNVRAILAVAQLALVDLPAQKAVRLHMSETLPLFGTYVGRVAVRATGSFNITIKQGKTVQGINHRSCAALHKCDGYSYR